MSTPRTMQMTETARAVLAAVGGPKNVVSVTSCFTRLRFVLNDWSQADKSRLEAVDGVLQVIRAGGQLQVVVGTNVPAVRQEVENLLSSAGLADRGIAEPSTDSGNVFDRFVSLVSALFQPFLWVLAGTGLLKAFLVVLTTLGWLDAKGSTYAILNAGADSLFYFLPMFLAFTAAQRFRANAYVSLALAGGLLYPALGALGSEGAEVTFLGLPVVMATYTSSVIPIIIVVWVQSHLERGLNRLLPGAVVNFLSPALVVLLLFPLSLMTIGPATTYLSDWIAVGLSNMYGLSPIVAGIVLGALAQVLVVFGLHWAVIGVIIAEYGTLGHSFTILPFYAAVAAQTGATIAVFVRARSVRLKRVAGPAALSGLLAGISEPQIYGVNIPLRRPFAIGVIAGAVGGAVVAASGTVSTAFAIPSLITMPVALGTGHFPLFVAGVVGALILAFVATFFFGVPRVLPAGHRDADPVAAPAASSDVTDGAANTTDRVAAPVSGLAVALSQVADPVFAQGSMGQGVAIEPSDGRVLAPVSGTVVAAMPHAYGIRTVDGVEVLVHVGINTVQLGGRHFTPAVVTGQTVAVSDLLVVVDLDAVTAEGFDPSTVVLVTNATAVGSVTPATAGRVDAGAALLTIHRSSTTSSK